MKLLFALIVFCTAFSFPVSAQVIDASVCDILANPQSYDSKTVRVRTTVIADFDEFALKASGCDKVSGAIWLAYPEDTHGKAGPVATVQFQLAANNSATPANYQRPPVKLEKNKDFKEFDSLLSTPRKSGGMCLGCVRYAVTATLVGRLDGANQPGIIREDGKVVDVSGYGNLNLFSSRLVLQSVSDVSAQELDYPRGVGGTADEQRKESPEGDAVAAAHDLARTLSPGSAAAKDVERAAAAFGKFGDDNGVEVRFGTPNEVARTDSPKGDHNSPDGLLINCTFNMERMKGKAGSTAIIHVGTHIADIRQSQSTVKQGDAYGLEYHAWQTTVLGVIGHHQKALTLSGGYVVFDSSWPEAQRERMTGSAIANFLAGESLPVIKVICDGPDNGSRCLAHLLCLGQCGCEGKNLCDAAKDPNKACVCKQPQQ